MFFGVSSSVTECFQSVTDYLQPVTELGTPKNMAVALPGMTLQLLYMRSEIKYYPIFLNQNVSVCMSCQRDYLVILLCII